MPFSSSDSSGKYVAINRAMCYAIGMSKKASPVILTPEETKVLQTLAVSRTASHRQVQRAHLVLAAAAGKTNQSISKEIGLSWRSVGMWRHRFIRERLAGLEDRPRPGKPWGRMDLMDTKVR